MYRFVSAPNYLGELIEWTGWAVLTWSAAGATFAFFTAANLVPRALTHHRWYRETFDDYPPERRAIVPFLL
jgi:protein-S-isoprenylcysteine O-methyltransferase Ste14